MNKLIFEASSHFTKMPAHWVKYLVSRYGKEYRFEGAGEHSEIIPIDKFEPAKFKKILTDQNNMAIIGKLKGEPLFMITPHHDKNNRYHIFEVAKSEGQYGSKGTTTYRRRRSSLTNDSYTLNEVADIINELFHAQGADFSGLTIEVITKDPKRLEKIQKRRELSQTAGDPLEISKLGYSKSPSEKQKEIIKKYADIKRKKLDVLVEKEKQNIINQINSILSGSIDKLIEKVKDGYTYSVDKNYLGKEIVAAIDISKIQKLAYAYDILKSKYSSEIPGDVAKKYKQLNIE